MVLDQATRALGEVRQKTGGDEASAVFLGVGLVTAATFAFVLIVAPLLHLDLRQGVDLGDPLPCLRPPQFSPIKG